MYKSIMKLLLIAALCVPWATKAQCTSGQSCPFSVTMYGDYSDSWSYYGTVSLGVYQNGTLVSTLDGDGNTQVTSNVTVCSGDSVYVIVSSWQNDYGECSFSINNTDGSTVVSLAYIEDYSQGDTVARFLPTCPTCTSPTNLTATGTTVSWVDNAASSWDIVWGSATFSPDTVTVNIDQVSTTSYDFSSFSDGLYIVYVRANCGSGDYSAWVGPVSIMVGGCTIVINGQDSYGDGWNGGSLDIIQGGVTLANFTISNGSTGTITVPVADDTVTFNWNTGGWETEVSFQILIGGTATVFSASGTPSSVNSFVLTDPCPSCMPPSALTATPHSFEVELSWVAGGDENAWEITAVSSIDTTVEYATDTFYTFQNLTAFTDYVFYVRAICGPDDSSFAISSGTISTLASCAMPQNLTVDSVTTTEIFLSWTPANNDDSQWSVTINDSNFVTTDYDPLWIDNLTFNTSYTISVRTLCGSDDSSFATTINTRTLAGDPISDLPYSCGFEVSEDGENEASDWILENGTQTNYWMVGTATNNGGSKALYITNDGSSNSYNNNVTSNSWAYANFDLSAGEYILSFDWKADGESCCDYLKAFLVPATTDITAGSSTTPSGATQFGGNMNVHSSWQTVTQTFTVTTAGIYKVAFLWHNDGSVGTQPPAAIDNIQLLQNTCPVPTAFTVDTISPYEATLSWTSIGDETEWGIRTVSNGITSDWESATSNPFTLTGLSSGTNYTFQLVAICGDGDTSLVVSTTGSTPVTCPAPTNFAVTVNDSTATADLSWTDATGSNWQVVYGSMGFNPYTSDDIYSTTTTSYQVTNLDTGFFDAYVRTNCGNDDYSVWAGPITFSYGVDVMNMATTGTDTLYTCAAIIYDDGGPSGSYSNSCQSTLVLLPSTPGSEVIISGSSYTEGTYDYLTIYDGVGTNGTVLWTDNGISSLTNFGPFMSDAITVVFHSDGSVTYSGFEINVACSAPSSCPRPGMLTVNSMQADSVVVNWTNPGNASNFELVVGTPGFIPDTVSNPITLTDTFYVFNNLFGGIAYQVYVRADCGQENSNWTGPIDFTPGQFIMGTSGSASIYMCGGVIYDDGGPNGQYSSSVDYQLTVYPSTPDSMLTFHGSFIHESCCDHLYIYEGAGTSGTILWQDGSASSNQTIPLDTCITGPITIRFTSDGSIVNEGVELYINCVAAPECAAVENVSITTGPTSAIITWEEGFFGSYSGATVEYKADTATAWITLPTVSGTYTTITGLNPTTDYDLHITALCEGFPGGEVNTSFTTNDFGCLQIDSSSSFSDTIINGTTTSNFIISYSFYNYSLTQQIFTAAELVHGGQYTSISFMPASYSVLRSYEIYMGHTSLTTATSYLNPADLTLVYSGTLVSMTAGQWNDIQLTTPFTYNGSDNLVLIIRDMTGSWNSGNSWYGADGTSDVSRYVYQDSEPFTIGYNGGSSSSFRSNLILAGSSCAVQNTCAAPVAAVTDVTTTTVDVAWAPGNTETSWNVYYRQAGAANFTTAATAVTSTSYQFTNLNAGTNYEFKVEGICDTQHLFTVVTAVTECAAISSLPFVEDFNNWGTGGLPNCWFNTGAYYTTSYSIISGNQNMTGTNGGSIYMYGSSSTSYVSRIIAPALDTSVYHINQVQAVFYVKQTSSYLPSFTVGVMSDPNDVSTFVPVSTVMHSGIANVWEAFEVPLDTYTGNGANIAIQTNSGGGYFYCYLDNFTIEPIPTCPRPDSLTASNSSSTSVDLAWHERGSATNWIIEYGPEGFTLGTGTQVAVSSNPYTLSNLPVAYSGEYYVRSVCSNTDTGEYSRTSCRFATSQIPATLPYLYTFENATEWQNWQTASNVSTIGWARGNATAAEGNYAMYVSNDGGTTWASDYTQVINASVYRDFDFGTTPNNYEVTFRAKTGGCFTSNGSIYDGIYVILVDPSDPLNVSSNAYTNPWGYMPSVNIYQDSVWDVYTLYFDSISGIKRIAINWYNTNSQSYGTIHQGGGAIDSFAVVLPSCQRPQNLTAVPASNSAQLSWDGEATSNYQIAYRPYPNGTSNTYVVVTGNQTTLSGLEPMTQYAYWVRKICGSNDTSHFSSGILFTTLMCDNAESAFNFDTAMTATTSSYTPLGTSFYNYGYVQTIIDSAYLANISGDITAMGFEPTTSSAGNRYENMTVYLANVSDSNLSNGWITPDNEHVFVKVIDSASFSYTEATMQIHGFDTAFTWDGHSNILVSVIRENGTYTSGATFRAHNHSVEKARYAYRDGSTYNYTNPGVAGTATTTVGDIYLISCGVGCARPSAPHATNVDYSSATLAWNGSADSYEVAVKAVTDATWPVEVTVNNAYSYAVNNLQPATQYQFRVRSICDATEGLISDWVVGNFITDSLPCFAPSAFQNTAVDMTTATFDWTVNGEETAWRIYVWNSTFNQSYDVTAHPTTVTGLTQTTDYFATVVAVCGGIIESESSDTVSFTTATCQPVSNVAVSNVSNNSATVSWSGSAASYTIEYGQGDFETGNGTLVSNITATSYEITGLVADRNYSVYVRADCDAQNPSAWSERIQFRTLEAEGIADVNGVNVTVYPNPTSDNTTIALSGVSGDVTITIVDLNGRTVKSDSMSCDGDCVKTLVVSGLAEGAYFVRINGEGLNMVKKLVVK